MIYLLLTAANELLFNSEQVHRVVNPVNRACLLRAPCHFPVWPFNLFSKIELLERLFEIRNILLLFCVRLSAVVPVESVVQPQ